jgi:hypothetical protein
VASFRSDSPADSPADSAELRLLGLLAVADRGVELQDRAEAVLRGCAGEDYPDIALAREGGYVAGEYHRLHGWAADADHLTDGDGLRELMALLLMQHCMLVHHAVRLAFPKAAHRPGLRRPIAPELGEPAARLRATRDELARRAGV